MTNQLTISVNMIVAVFAMFGIGYYVGMQYSDNKSTVSSVFPFENVISSVVFLLMVLIFSGIFTANDFRPRLCDRNHDR